MSLTIDQLKRGRYTIQVGYFYREDLIGGKWDGFYFIFDKHLRKYIAINGSILDQVFETCPNADKINERLSKYDVDAVIFKKVEEFNAESSLYDKVIYDTVVDRCV